MGLSIREALVEFELDNRARRLSPRTLEYHRSTLTPFAAWCEGHDADAVGAITPALIRAYLVSLQDRQLSDNTIHGSARAIKRFLNFCVQEELIALSPMRKVRMPTIAKRILPAFTEADVERLLAACWSKRDKAVILVLLDTGLRASEFIALDGSDVDLELGVVRVRQGKGGKDRTVYLGQQSREALGRYLEHRTIRPSGALWRNRRGEGRLTTDALRLQLRRIGWRAGVAHCHPHTFRRTFALWSLRAGMSIYHLQRLMGHEDIGVLQRYLALVENDLQAAHTAHGAVDSILSKKG